MLQIRDEDVLARMRFDNPWWETGVGSEEIAALPERDYFPPFFELVNQTDPKRAIVLMGARRVGKTVLMRQAIGRLLRNGVPKQAILYLSIDAPLYGGLPLETLLRLYLDTYGVPGQAWIFFDEIQYLKDWEVHLKSLVDSRPDIKFVVSGSAAAALRMKSRESGAGRFTDFLLPPLTFAEFLRLASPQTRIDVSTDEHGFQTFATEDIGALNRQFVDYLNYGGYPELALSKTMRRDIERYVGSDIVEKVLLRDIPSLYGIGDVTELNNLFRVLAYNTSQEVSLEGLSQSSQISKNTIKRYIEYLEASFLIRTVERVDINARRFERARNFKVYLTNPALRAALFGPIDADDDRFGALVETGIFCQWFHNASFQNDFRYARWKDGEVDLIYLGPSRQAPEWAIEIKWTDRYYSNPSELQSLLKFCKSNGFEFMEEGPLEGAVVTTRTKSGNMRLQGIPIAFLPSALHAYGVGYNIAAHNAKVLGGENNAELRLPEPQNP